MTPPLTPEARVRALAERLREALTVLDEPYHRETIAALLEEAAAAFSAAFSAEATAGEIPPTAPENYSWDHLVPPATAPVAGEGETRAGLICAQCHRDVFAGETAWATNRGFLCQTCAHPAGEGEAERAEPQEG